MERPPGSRTAEPDSPAARFRVGSYGFRSGRQTAATARFLVLQPPIDGSRSCHRKSTPVRDEPAAPDHQGPPASKYEVPGAIRSSASIDAPHQWAILVVRACRDNCGWRLGPAE